MSERTEHVVVMTTTDSAEEAEALARALVEQRLAACVQLTPVASHYVWEGRATRGEEILLLIKTRADRSAGVRQHLDRHHSYDTPEVVEIPVTGGSPGYLRWIDESVEDAGPGDPGPGRPPAGEG